MDSSGNGYNLAAFGTPTFDPSARGGQGALVLNGTDYFFASSFPALLPTGSSSYTLSAWFKIGTSTMADYGIIGWGNYGSNTNALRTDSANQVVNYWWGNDIYNAPSNGLNIYDGQWHLIAATFDGSVRKLYIDPQAVNGTMTQQSSGSPNVPAANFTIGRTCPYSVCAGNDTGSGLGETFVGELSDVRVYSGALTSAEIISGNQSVPEPTTFALVLLPVLLAMRRQRVYGQAQRVKIRAFATKDSML